MFNPSINKIIVGITGASGVIYGITLLNILKQMNIETHLIISKSAHLTILAETDLTVKDLTNIADYSYNPNDIGAKISSGSFKVDGMIIAPCSMKTLASIANGFECNLISRAANVVIKEQKKLVLMVRETPLSAIHLENMLKLSRLGIAIFPPVPAFYNNPKTIDNLVIHSVCRVLDLFNIDANMIERWKGLN
ncbi:MAG: UbiX family flavin prenyltransferase [Rickettsiales bacterium]|nr:MAG: UbiX family flavin prenyltransferase [Rickettsiales bacterium]